MKQLMGLLGLCDTGSTRRKELTLAVKEDTSNIVARDIPGTITIFSPPCHCAGVTMGFRQRLKISSKVP